MDFVKKISNYLLSLGFEIQPVRVPMNSKEQIKRDMYLIINDKSKTIFNFLNKHFPVKYSKERPDKSIWFIFRDRSGKPIEICVKPESKETIKNMEFLYSDFNFSHYIIDVLLSGIWIPSPLSGNKMLHPSTAATNQNDSFSLDIYLEKDIDFIKILEYNLMKVPSLQSIIRDNKLSNIIYEANSKGF